MFLEFIAFMYLYQHTPCFFAQYPPGLEEFSHKELLALGASDIKPGYLGWYFVANLETLYRINYCSRFLIRILAPLQQFDCYNPEQLYEHARQIEWKDFLNLQQTFAVFATVANSNITHSQYAALKIKDAVADYFRDHFQQRPNVDTDEPHLWINLHLDFNQASIQIDTSGGSLHRRGYRKQAVTAPMQETLAAAIIEWSEWDGQRPLYDPMCGSGTLLCEAMIRYCRIPAGFLRKHFGFEQLPDFNPALWQQVKQVANKNIRPLPADLIAGSDISHEHIMIARKNCHYLPEGDNINLQTTDYCKIEQLKDKTIVCNPPYGVRMGEQDMAEFYKKFGDFLKQHCQRSTAYIYFGERQWLKHIGLRTTWKKELPNGGLDGRLAKLELY